MRSRSLASWRGPLASYSAQPRCHPARLPLHRPDPAARRPRPRCAAAAARANPERNPSKIYQPTPTYCRSGSVRSARRSVQTRQSTSWLTWRSACPTRGGAWRRGTARPPGVRWGASRERSTGECGISRGPLGGMEGADDGFGWHAAPEVASGRPSCTLWACRQPADPRSASPCPALPCPPLPIHPLPLPLPHA